MNYRKLFVDNLLANKTSYISLFTAHNGFKDLNLAFNEDQAGTTEVEAHQVGLTLRSHHSKATDHGEQVEQRRYHEAPVSRFQPSGRDSSASTRRCAAAGMLVIQSFGMSCRPGKTPSPGNPDSGKLCCWRVGCRGQ